jgi:hypothetical protein
MSVCCATALSGWKGAARVTPPVLGRIKARTKEVIRYTGVFVGQKGRGSEGRCENAGVSEWKNGQIEQWKNEWLYGCTL